MTAPTPATWPPTRLCPATSNLPTRMLAITWQALCAAMQRREAVDGRRGWKGGLDFYEASAARFPCAVCGGQTLPPGLELITQEEAEQMARQTKRGICELCGAHTNVGMNHGSAACPACTHVQTALNKRPEAVAKAIRAMHKTEEMLGHLIPAGGLAVHVTAEVLREISGIVGYDGEDPAELVEAVRRRVLTCASCDSEDVLHEIREIVGYVPEQGDKGLADAVRAFADRRPDDVQDCAECDAAEALLEIAELVGKRGASSGLVVEAVREAAATPTTSAAAPYWADLMRACGVEDDGGPAVGWLATAAAIQTIGEQDRELYQLREQVDILLGTTKWEREDATRLRDELTRTGAEVEQLRDELSVVRAELTLAEQSRDEWEQLAVEAKDNVETLEAELRSVEEERDQLRFQVNVTLGGCQKDLAPTRRTDNAFLLEIALRALRGDGPDADQLATLIDAARRAA